MINFYSFRITEIVLESRNLTPEKVDVFLQFASQQNNIEKITCISDYKLKNDTVVENFMNFPSTVTNLRDLRMVLRANEISWKAEWSDLLSTSNLKTLRIVCDKFRLENENYAYPPVEELTDFAIDMKICKNLDIAPLLNSFPNLRHLYLSHINDHMLQSVCANQV